RPHVLRRPPITAAAIPAPTSIPSAPHNHGATASAASPRNQAMTFSADTTLDKPKRSTTNRRTHLLRHYPCRRGRVPKSPCRAETPFRCVENPTLSPVRGDNGGQRRDGPAPASRAGGGAATGRSAENRRPPLCRAAARLRRRDGHECRRHPHEGARCANSISSSDPDARSLPPASDRPRWPSSTGGSPLSPTTPPSCPVGARPI